MYPIPNNLSTFSSLFIVKAVLCFLFSFMGLFMSLAGTIEFSGDPQKGIAKICAGVFIIIASITLGILYIYTSKYLRLAKNYNFILVMSIICCIGTVLSIILGLMTIVEINKTHIKIMFQKNKFPHLNSN